MSKWLDRWAQNILIFVAVCVICYSGYFIVSFKRPGAQPVDKTINFTQADRDTLHETYSSGRFLAPNRFRACVNGQYIDFFGDGTKGYAGIDCWR